jgi:hypothetical protein
MDGCCRLSDEPNKDKGSVGSASGVFRGFLAIGGTDVGRAKPESSDSLLCRLRDSRGTLGQLGGGGLGGKAIRGKGVRGTDPTSAYRWLIEDSGTVADGGEDWLSDADTMSPSLDSPNNEVKDGSGPRARGARDNLVDSMSPAQQELFPKSRRNEGESEMKESQTTLCVSLVFLRYISGSLATREQ